MWKTICALIVAIAANVSAAAGATEIVKLHPAHTDGGMPLMQALKERRSTRDLLPDTLPGQLLSNLLWAAAGVNRPQSGKRTAPSARNWQEIDVYVVTVQGAYRYDPDAHALHRVVAGDFRALTGTQDFVAEAPLNLVYVANLDRMNGVSSEQQTLYAAADTGFIAQNVYLFCASEGLGAVVRGSVDRQALAAALGLSSVQRVMLAQTVGYPRRHGPTP